MENKPGTLYIFLQESLSLLKKGSGLTDGLNLVDEVYAINDNSSNA